MKIITALIFILYVVPSFILAFFTLFFLPVFSYNLYHMFEAQKWPSKLAVITKSKEGYLYEYSKGIKPRGFAKIYAQYPDSDKEFKVYSFYSKKRTLDSFLDELSSNGQTYAQDVANRYSVGEQVRVYTNPDNPKYRVLDPDSENRYTNILNMIKICFMILGNFLFYLFVVRRWLKKLKIR